MFTFGVSYFPCLNFLYVAIYVCSLYMLLIVGVFMRARCVCSLCILIVCLFREMGKWDLGGMGDGLLNGLMGETGSVGGSVSNLVIK